MSVILFGFRAESPQTFDFFASAKNSRRFGVANEAKESTEGIFFCE